MNITKEIDYIVSQIIRNYQPQKIILFGSQSNGTSDLDSDIDLFVVKDTQQPLRERLRELKKNLDYRVPLDIIVYTPQEMERYKEQPGSFVWIVLKEGRIIYEQ